jgi:16S rRNA processing protein RimM
LTVAATSWAGGKLVVHFAGVDDRDRAATLAGVRLVVAAADRPALDDPDDFYDTDLVGLAAVGIDGTDYGPVRDVVHAGGADYLLLDVDGRERLVPFVAAIVPSVDLSAGRLVLDPPPGLFEL